MRVGLDDGHGFETAGKRTPDGYRENEFNHWTKEYLTEALQRCGIEVVDCSPDRSDNSLQNRCDIANNNNCDIFVSIHYNAMGNVWNNNVGGIETYHWPNSVDGENLANLIHAELIKGTALWNRGVKSEDFYVLRNTNMPAVLCECGFMDNPYEASLMKSDGYRKECSEEICRGICNYFGVQYKSTTTTEKERAIKVLQSVSNYANNVWIPEFTVLEEKGLNIWGLILKLKDE